MRILLDTHVFLWFILDDRRLTAAARSAICDAANDVFLSPASVWEAIVKHQIGRLALPVSAETYLPMQRERHHISSLPIDEASVARIATLPPLHRDPFDRVLNAQALHHDPIVATSDTVVRQYPVRVFDM